MQSATKHSRHKPSHFGGWGDSLMNQLKGTTRKRRKRQASKKRRFVQKRELSKSS